MIVLTDNKYIIDSSAWIEYFLGSESGEKVRKIIDNKKNIIITPNIVYAEVVSKLSRNGVYEKEHSQVIQGLSLSVPETPFIYIQSGINHSEMRQNCKNVSLADAIIKTLALEQNASIVTKDNHLKGDKTIMI